MGGTSTNGASGGADLDRVRRPFRGRVGMVGVGCCELVLAHCWVLGQQAPGSLSGLLVVVVSFPLPAGCTVVW